MIRTELLRLLTLEHPESPGRHPHVSTASGIVRVGRHLYVVADDSHHLAQFEDGSTAPGRLFRLFPGELPLDRAERKARKPDLEAICVLPSYGPFGALLAVPSGSTPVRRRGALLPLGPGGALAGRVDAIDFTTLYHALETELGVPNLEGAAVLGDHLYLLNRGAGVNGVDALVDLDLQRALAGLAAQRLDASALRGVKRFELAALGGVRLSFTDAAPLPGDRLVFTAAAEATPNAYLDGEILGSAIGLLENGAVTFLEVVDARLKLEGVTASEEDGQVKMLLVSDEDDPERAAPLLAAAVSA